MAGPRRVVILVFPDVQLLDVAGPLEVFDAASEVAGSRGPAYEVEVVAPRAGTVTTSSGLRLQVDRAAATVRGAVDTLVVAGGEGARCVPRDDDLVRWVAATARRARRVTSVCTGAFLLAEAGVLEGRRATTHWAYCGALAERYPGVDVDPAPIFVRDGDVWTSAGVTAGMDLALALVEEDHGRDVALEVARWLVLYVKRPGGQTQFSVQLASQLAEREPLRDLQAWIAEHPAADLSVTALAARAGMSTRNFARAFRAETGVTPAAYVESVRLEVARRLLETTSRSVDDVARACGFGRVETLHRAFKRQLGVTPGQYRRHFEAA